jgi:hypothetical protein
MKFIYIDPDTGCEYSFDFASPNAPPKGFILHIRVPTNSLFVEDRIDMVSIHTDHIQVIDGKPIWQEYHIRPKDPFTTPAVREYVEKLIKLRAFM